MLFKLILLYCISKETGTGMIRMRETKGVNIFKLAGGYGGVIKIILRSRSTIFALMIYAVVNIVNMINTTFWQVIATKKILAPHSALPMFMVLRSVVAILFLFFVTPRLIKGLLKNPLLIGFACYFIGQSLLIFVPVEGVLRYPLLCLSLIFDGFGFSALAMLTESLVAIHINPDERARILAVNNMLMMLLTAPFGWIAGFLSDISKNLPFTLNLFMLIIGVTLTFFYYNGKQDHTSEA
jgi:hypothetical protein